MYGYLIYMNRSINRILKQALINLCCRWMENAIRMSPETVCGIDSFRDRCLRLTKGQLDMLRIIRNRLKIDVRRDVEEAFHSYVLIQKLLILEKPFNLIFPLRGYENTNERRGNKEV